MNGHSVARKLNLVLLGFFMGPALVGDMAEIRRASSLVAAC